MGACAGILGTIASPVAAALQAYFRLEVGMPREIEQLPWPRSNQSTRSKESDHGTIKGSMDGSYGASPGLTLCLLQA